MQAVWIGPAITAVVALIAALGTILTILVQRRTRQVRREDLLNKRIIRLMNYSQRLRDAIYAGKKPPPEEWPDDLYDQ